MAIDTALGAPVFLGLGKYICPPAGWAQDGFVTADNPYWLLPKSRLRWSPPGQEGVSLHWHLSPVPLPEALMRALIEVLRVSAGAIDQARLAPLYPGLIRMPLDSVTAAQVVSYPRSGRLLRVEYAISQYNELGIVHYAPTEMYEFGEYEMLAYEGKDPEYSKYLNAAIAAMESFAVGRPLAEGPAPPAEALTEAEPEGRKPSRLTEEIQSLLPWNLAEDMAATLETPQTGESPLDFTPGSAGPEPAPQPQEPPAQPEAKPAESPPEQAAPAQARVPEPAVQPPATQPTAREGEAAMPSPAPGKLRTVEYVLKEGETMRTVVKARWPELDAEGVMKRVRDIYALNAA
ncbi:MAG TPA: hypothetical protein V6D08_18935, partial [Candidatus Obscuribacterales bacterium]